MLWVDEQKTATKPNGEYFRLAQRCTAKGTYPHLQLTLEAYERGGGGGIEE